MHDDRPGAVFLQLAVDFPDDLLALLLIGLGRLPVDQRVDLPIAVAGVVALRAADVVLVELLVRIVDAAAGQIEADQIILAGDPAVQTAVSTTSRSPSI